MLYPTPNGLPVDGDYELWPEVRALIAGRARRHGFDLLAPATTRRLSGTWQSRPSRRPSVVRHQLTLRRPVTLAAHRSLLLPELDARAGGVVGGAICGRGAGWVSVGGERLPGNRTSTWRLRPPLFGRAWVTAGDEALRLTGIDLWTYGPGHGEDVDRYALHVPLRVRGELHLPLAAGRRGRLVELASVHWGSVEYRQPRRDRPLGAYYYPWYRDGVLGSVYGVVGKEQRLLARDKFVEFDEIENIHGFSPCTLDALVVRLRARNPRVHSPVCRLAAIEVRYRRTAQIRRHRIRVGRWIRAGRAARIPLPRANALVRLDLKWFDNGPAMARVRVAGSKSPFVNVCRNELRSFSYLHGGHARSVSVEAWGADVFLRWVDAYYARER